MFNRLITLFLCIVLALHGGLSFIVQNQQLLFLSAQAPDGYKLICTGTEMRWVSIRENTSASGDDKSRFVFLEPPDLEVSGTESASHHEHHHHDMSMHAHHQQATQQDSDYTAALMEQACPEQTFLELQQSAGVAGSAILVSFAGQYNHYEFLPTSPYICFQYSQKLSRGPPLKFA